MKRFHVHLRVEDLARSISFYSRLLNAPPTRVEDDYAKWMIDDPALNFAISTRGGRVGVDHLGIQADGAADLLELKARAQAADMSLLDEGETTCCYSRSDKYWVTDPQGIAWEHFQTLDSVPVYSESSAASSVSACCGPAKQQGIPLNIAVRVAGPAAPCCQPGI
ncbi:ArsI/CadI family heavy metal resistance metalloenzyme [Uliginosibacterium sp. H3]|uniref:ArsI/CadI family heavy metal resistance metalloenzyme n=1 Tax=Uliginosibacterium silvisoli TaxID=3114758 RepID=A0ABU6JXR6_9RHOO|nr:ArsI/CadI family heavy metal resistance metalloenzyme [Uliginosibacterium sp. H3]